MFGFGIKQYIMAGAALAIVTGIFFGVRHYEGVLSDLEVARANEAKLELAVETQKDAIDAAVENANDWQSAYAELQEQAAVLRQIATEAQAEQERLNDLFAEHNITDLAIAKPGLIENRLNSGTDRIGRLLECASGRTGSCDGPD